MCRQTQRRATSLREQEGDRQVKNRNTRTTPMSIVGPVAAKCIDRSKGCPQQQGRDSRPAMHRNTPSAMISSRRHNIGRSAKSFRICRSLPGFSDRGALEQKKERVVLIGAQMKRTHTRTWPTSKTGSHINQYITLITNSHQQIRTGIRRTQSPFHAHALV